MQNHEVTKKKSGVKASAELRAGEPVLGAQGPDGSRFLGWVLVQVWEPVAGTAATASHSGITVNWSGGAAQLMDRAATELSKLSQTLPR